jgi:DNA/RNA non-specific endonuclease
MTGTVAPTSNSVVSLAQSAMLPQGPADIARAMIAGQTDRLGRIAYGALLRDLDALAARDPALGRNVEQEMATQLGARGYQQLTQASYNIRASDGTSMTIARNAPTVRAYFDGEQGASGREFYGRLDRLWGDGDIRTYDGSRIEAGISEMLSRGLTLAQYEQITARAQQTASANANGTDNSALLADLGQMALDIVGIFDPTPTADLVNAGISAWRGDGWGAFLSVLSAVPYIGDVAKLGKLGKWAQTIASAVEAAATNPAARQALEPALRRISELIGSLPARGLDALPANARATLQDIKGRIDGLFGATATRADDAALAAGASTARIGRNSAEWTLDAQGRPTRATATLSELQPAGAARGSDELSAQDRVRGRGLDDDDAGHVIGHRFMGDQGDRNMFPQNFNFNRSAYKTMENEWAAWIQNGGTVRVNVELIGGGGARPDRVAVSYEVFDQSGASIFARDARFTNAANQTFDRISTAEIARRMAP